MNSPSCSFRSFLFGSDGRYQLCSCGRHIWSTQAKKVIYIHANDLDHVRVTTSTGQRMTVREMRLNHCMKLVYGFLRRIFFFVVISMSLVVALGSVEAVAASRSSLVTLLMSMLSRARATLGGSAGGAEVVDDGI